MEPQATIAAANLSSDHQVGTQPIEEQTALIPQNVPQNAAEFS
jgi:hypothetical protein